jgi:hypothetical protein
LPEKIIGKQRKIQQQSTTTNTDDDDDDDNNNNNNYYYYNNNNNNNKNNNDKNNNTKLKLNRWTRKNQQKQKETSSHAYLVFRRLDSVLDRVVLAIHQHVRIRAVLRIALTCGSKGLFHFALRHVRHKGIVEADPFSAAERLTVSDGEENEKQIDAIRRRKEQIK